MVSINDLIDHYDAIISDLDKRAKDLQLLLFREQGKIDRQFQILRDIEKKHEQMKIYQEVINDLIYLKENFKEED